MRILVVNCGSATLKLELLELTTPADGDFEQAQATRLAQGNITGIGGQAKLSFEAQDVPARQETAPVKDLHAALGLAVDWLGQMGRLDAVGHRVVHGGPFLFEPALIDGRVIQEIAAAAELAPLHNGPALEAIRAARAHLGEDVSMVAVFDTAFHRSLPERAANYAIPPDMAQRHGIRRYGFHGLAHRFMTRRCAELMGQPAEQLKLVTLQLGGGSSATAVEAGQSIDTSMGLTPLEGLVMGSRAGDIDPAVTRLLGERAGMGAAEVERWLNKECGLLGVSGSSKDAGELLRREQAGDARAALALEMFCYRVRKYIGAYMAALGGADAVAFGGGIGENNPELRARICRGMTWCGLELDEQRNQALQGEEGEISAAGSRVRAFVIAVDEQIVIARDTAACVLALR